VARQKREPVFDLAPAPPGYSLINASYFKKLKIAENQLTAGLQINNLLNTEYKEYMNRFRYFTADMGRNITLKLNYQF
jgi:iron complex outermembrane receptor protein